MRTPDLTQRVIGFRQWHVDEQCNLMPVGTPAAGPWKPGPQHAQCWSKHGNMRMPCLSVAEPSCDCGFYALFDLRAATAYGGISDEDTCVQGIVTGWGRMAVHQTGFRAEWIQVMAIIVPDSRIDPWLDPRNQDRFPLMYRGVAKKYGIPCMDYSHATEFAREFGAEMPESLKPSMMRGLQEQERFFALMSPQDAILDTTSLRACRDEAARAVVEYHKQQNPLTKDLPKWLLDTMEELDPSVPEAMAGLYDIYVPNSGDLLTALNHPPVANYVAFPEEPIEPLDLSDECYLLMESTFMLHIATNGHTLWLPGNLGD